MSRCRCMIGQLLVGLIVGRLAMQPVKGDISKTNGHEPVAGERECRTADAHTSLKPVRQGLVQPRRYRPQVTPLQRYLPGELNGPLFDPVDSHCEKNRCRLGSDRGHQIEEFNKLLISYPSLFSYDQSGLSVLQTH